MSGPLEGVKVLDLSRILAGPYCTMMLGDMGAEIIKIEQPGSGDDTRTWGPPWVGTESAYYLSINRNKRTITFAGTGGKTRTFVAGPNINLDQLEVGDDVALEITRAVAVDIKPA